MYSELHRANNHIYNIHSPKPSWFWIKFSGKKQTGVRKAYQLIRCV